jgi:hypothetical protein
MPPASATGSADIRQADADHRCPGARDTRQSPHPLEPGVPTRTGYRRRRGGEAPWWVRGGRLGEVPKPPVHLLDELVELAPPFRRQPVARRRGDPWRWAVPLAAVGSIQARWSSRRALTNPAAVWATATSGPSASAPRTRSTPWGHCSAWASSRHRVGHAGSVTSRPARGGRRGAVGRHVAIAEDMVEPEP